MTQEDTPVDPGLPKRTRRQQLLDAPTPAKQERMLWLSWVAATMVAASIGAVLADIITNPDAGYLLWPPCGSGH